MALGDYDLRRARTDREFACQELARAQREEVSAQARCSRPLKVKSDPALWARVLKESRARGGSGAAWLAQATTAYSQQGGRIVDKPKSPREIQLCMDSSRAALMALDAGCRGDTATAETAIKAHSETQQQYLNVRRGGLPSWAMWAGLGLGVVVLGFVGYRLSRRPQ